MNNDSPLELEDWCKTQWISVYDMWTEEYYNDYLENFIFDVRISWIEENWDLRVEIENWKHKKYLSWYRDINIIQ